MSAEPKPDTCYDCIHHTACKWTWQYDQRLPFKDDDHIGPFLKAVNEAIAQACSAFTKIGQSEPTS